MFAPVAVLMTMGEIEPPDVTGNFDQSVWMQSLDSEQQNQIAQTESAGQQIASAMESAGVREQTIKAQLIYAVNEILFGFHSYKESAARFQFIFDAFL